MNAKPLTVLNAEVSDTTDDDQRTKTRHIKNIFSRKKIIFRRVMIRVQRN